MDKKKRKFSSGRLLTNEGDCKAVVSLAEVVIEEVCGCTRIGLY